MAFRLQGNLGFSPLVIGFWRATLAGLALAGGLALRRPGQLAVAPRDLPFFAACGLVTVSCLYIVYPYAVQQTSVAVAAVLLYTAPAWVVLLGAGVLGEPLTGRKLLALALCFGGTALVAGVLDPSALRGSTWGLAAGLASGLAYSTLSLFGRVTPERYSSPTLTAWTLGFGALFLAVPALGDPDALLAPWRTLPGAALLLYVGVVPTAGSLLFYLAGLRHLGDAGRASLLATLEPLVGAVLGFAILGEALAPTQVLGGVLVLAGVLVLQLRRG